MLTLCSNLKLSRCKWRSRSAARCLNSSSQAGATANAVDVMVIGDLHLQENVMDAFYAARDQMKVLPTRLATFLFMHLVRDWTAISW